MRRPFIPSSRTAGFIVVVLLILVALWATLLRTIERVETVPVARGDIESSVTALGTLQPHSYVDIGAQASGEIRRIHVRPGDAVSKGQLLVEIDPSVQQAKVDVDRASLESLRAQLAGEFAQRDYAREQLRRQQRMMADGSTREQDLQSADATLRGALASLDNLRAQISGAQSTLKGDTAQLGYTRIYAPMAGTVVTLDAREGQTLNSTYQTPIIMRIADLSTMTVWTQVSEADVLRVKRGMPVYFTTLGSDERRWTSHVAQILPAPPNPAPSGESSQNGTQSGAPAASKVVLYTALFDVANRDAQLMPQMSAQVFFVIDAAQRVLSVPLASLTPVAGASAGTYRARVLVDGRVVERQVRTGVHDRLHAQVLSGLQQGDLLVTGVKRVRAIDGRFEW
ncbi:efflux RND transporter periplasmic adaptor subunit [Paraburkholderia sp. BCC1886]|uniref:efflux RND transporter periplasmic adaptor subunit n=1 Tax=Paraburkholderia sp. BCC1886 TaxID=2562670 RepID=UPI001182D891|nr:efflux RND transporter periplasmic adaptor subunit [Paraburkholderia sp. BCC1886]